MAVNLSPVGGVAAQFFDNSGQVLTGGKIYSYLAGTTTPAVTYTTSSGITPQPNPIILNAAGRVADSGEIWITDGVLYKFVLKDQNDVLIATYDNVVGINSNFINYTGEEETQTATQGQTVFTLTTLNYQPGTNNLLVFVNGSKQVPVTNFIETSSTVVTFIDGLNVGDVVDFCTATPINTTVTTAGSVSFIGFKSQTGNVQDLADDNGADWIGFLPASTNAVARSAQDKMRDLVSVKDFNAKGDGTTDDTAAIQNALNSGSLYVFVPQGTYKITSTLTIPTGVEFYGSDNSSVLSLGANAVMLTTTGSNVVIRDIKLNGNSSTYIDPNNNAIYVNWVSLAGSNCKISNVSIINIAGAGVIGLASSTTASSDVWIENCNIENTGTHGIITQDYISNVWIIGNKVKYTGLLFADRPGITASRDGSNVTIANNICIGSPSALGASVHGISVDGTTNASVTGNNVLGWIGYGIEVGFSTNCTVSANTITNVQNAGIALSAIQSLSLVNTNVTISGNTITSSGAEGIYSFISGGTGTLFNKNISVVGNTVNGSVNSNGINMGLCNFLTITGNSVCNNYLSGIYVIDCKNVLTSGNTVVNNNISTLVSVSSLTQSSGTATVTTSTNHGYTTGNFITIMNAVPAEYNGTFSITVTGTTTFTYAVSPTSLQTPALALSGGILCTKPNSLSAGGIRPLYSVLTSKETLVFGHNTVMDNGYIDYYSPNYNGVIGFWNDGLYLRSSNTPYVENLTTGSNQKDRAALIMKNGKITVAYNNAGTLTYATLPLDGSTTSWTNSSTTP